MPITEAELVEEVYKGDIDAFNKLISRYTNAVYGVAYSKLGDFHIAQDIAQEVFVKAYKKLSYLKQPDKVGSWLYSVTTRECIDWLRSNKQEFCELEDSIGVTQQETAEEKLLKKEVSENVWKALNSLSEGNRLVTILYHIDDYKIKDIANFLGVSIDAVESRLRRSRKLLKKELLGMVDESLNKNKLGEEFKQKVFQDERMPESLFRNVCMGQTEFDNADMSNVKFHNINMTGVKFDDINMDNSTFYNVNMYEIDIGKAWIGGAYIHDVIMEKGKSNKFENCELNGTLFKNCSLSNVDITDCNITGLKINGVLIEELLEKNKR